MSIMIVNSVNYINKSNQSFQARGAELRFADQILRNTNREFPRISVSRINDFFISHSSQITPSQQLFFEKISAKLKLIRDFKPSHEMDESKYILFTLAATKKNRLANCSDSANLAKAALSANGIESTRVALHGYTADNISTNFDHCFLIVNMAHNAILSKPSTYGKNAYVVDAWNGFVERVPSAFKRFEAAYSGDIRMCIVKRLGVKVNDYNINQETIDKILKEYPKLKLDKKI